MNLFDFFKLPEIIEENKKLKEQLNEVGYPDIEKARQILSDTEKQTDELTIKLTALSTDVADLQSKSDKLDKQLKTNTNRLSQIKDYANRVNYAIDNYINSDTPNKILSSDIEGMEELSPSVMLKLHCMDVKDLKKAYKANDKQIDDLFKLYSARYSTKANKAIYNLMVIALRAELQNILYNLKYEKLDKSIDDIKKVTQKYLKIAGDGNQSIVTTLTKFIGEIEYLFINAVKIEYNYYVKKEQAKQEQLALKEQMRQEAEERKALEAERKKIAKEEEKYNTEIEKIKQSLSDASEPTEIEKLQARIKELQGQLSEVILKKEEISNLQNGKAGTVYIISNIGSFGEDVFKIGMTRRLEPQDRINELGSASVPFKFDVHSFIFSQDAVALENKMHQILNRNRVNKVNLRKEFFRISIDELEKIVDEIEPTAEFNKTILAEEFKQSISSDENYTSNLTFETDDYEDEE